jgi:MFS family permease
VTGRPSQRPLVALLTGSGISLVGTRLSVIALPLFVLVTTGSATRTGLVAFAELGPLVISQALTGPVTDRLGPRRMSIASDLASGMVLALVPLLHAVGSLGFGTLLVIVAVTGLARGPGDSAKYVLTPEIAAATGQPPERILGLTDGINRASSVVGPLGAAALVVLIGAPMAIAVDAASFLASAAIIGLGLPAGIGRRAAHQDRDPASYLAQLRSGAAFVRSDGLLRSIVGMVATTNLLDQALATVLLVVWARSRGGGAGLMGVVAATMGVGALIGALAAAWIGHRLPRRLTFAVGFFVVGGPRFLVLGLGAPLWVVLPVIFVGGLGAGTINPVLGAVQLERIPEHLRARVMALMISASWALMPFGGLVGGVLSDRFGIGPALLVCGAVYTVATTLPAVRPEWRQMDRRVDEDPGCQPPVVGSNEPGQRQREEAGCSSTRRRSAGSPSTTSPRPRSSTATPSGSRSARPTGC